MESYNQIQKPKSLLSKVIDTLLVLVMIGVSVATLLSYLAPTFNPYTFWYIAFLGLGGQFLMLANVIFMLIFVIKKSRWALMPIAVFLIGIGYIGDFLQMSLVTKYNSDEKASRNELKIMTYNVHGFFALGSSSFYSANLDSIVSFISRENPDIVCLQEYQLINRKDHSAIEAQMSAWKYRAMSYLVDDNYHKWGLAVFSKLPLTNATAIRFADRENSSMFVDVQFRDATIRLFNNHLQSTRFNSLNRAELRSEDAEKAARLVGSTLRGSYKVRAFQADTIASIIKQSPFPTIVVGDFNDTPMSYVYNTIKGDMEDTFREKGESYQYTYKPLKSLFRIDYILHSKGFETISQDSPYTSWSDHKPVIARIKVE